MIEELKQRIIAKSSKLKRYEQRITQFRRNRTFNVDQKNIYMELNGSAMRSTDVPNAEESRIFWVGFGVLRKSIAKQRLG